ncbi:glycoside hydrolase family 13 protein [Hoyosella subflava]|uniref:Alpha-glucosidase n=1 Tax=Hoyosella subflava (strain DSM 45089 / JCM 17490 / NBRC 109087 / DQS3-9A1) TaxID=443218 RepID=F6EJU6_HOYSD|nr:alpha-amylase family glycosyl hydrolase [Hoyosella subflava]AEF40121.1 Alpha-glucosidase [Hoyosella subflava DQS3-9A1]
MENWWKSAVVYQVYIRSFADGNGDGIGDLPGLREKLPYLSSLGIDAIWITPWYTSPMVDAGYDVADFRDIDPSYGTLHDAEALIRDAHALGIKVIIDIVPNHTSSEHRWFHAALRDEANAKQRYIFRDGQGTDGSSPPNDWTSAFGGPAWTRLPNGEWYLHMFAPEQPDLNWENPEVRAEFEDILAFWFARGIDGFRIDVAHGLVKHPELPDAGPRPEDWRTQPHPARDQDGVHDIYRTWRKVAETFTPERIFVAEAVVPTNERLARYLRPDELHTAFQFDFTRAPWRANSLRDVIDDAVSQAATVGAPATWVLSSHDIPRPVTRYARSQPEFDVQPEWDRARWSAEEPDLELGKRRARAAALLQLALPGTAYIYQGDELGLDEVESLPPEVRNDPTWAQSGYTDVGRDGCRVPLPWSGTSPPFGFSPEASHADPWLPQPEHWESRTVLDQQNDNASFVWLYRSAIHLRTALFPAETELEWLGFAGQVLAFQRGDSQCWVNLGDEPVDLPAGWDVVLESSRTHGDSLPSDTAVWMTRSPF